VILADERLESLAQFLAHENPLVNLDLRGMEVRGADVWGLFVFDDVDQIAEVLDRVAELAGE
jgi:hypothetical protein